MNNNVDIFFPKGDIMSFAERWNCSHEHSKILTSNIARQGVLQINFSPSFFLHGSVDLDINFGRLVSVINSSRYVLCISSETRFNHGCILFEIHTSQLDLDAGFIVKGLYPILSILDREYG